MNKAKRRVWPMPPWMLALAGLGIVFFESGCSGLTGLRSVAPDRPSVLNFWDKPQAGSPTPGTDHYAQNVHAEQQRVGLEARGADGPLLAQASPIDPLDESPSVDSDADDKTRGPRVAANSSASAPKDRMTHVTLGRPEPLPALALDAQTQKLAATARSGSWRAEQSTIRSGRPEPEQPDDSHKLALSAPPRTSDVPDSSKSRDGRAILAQAETKLRRLRTYKLKVSRIERVGGQLQPQEDLLLSVRTQPKAVRLEWADGPNKGREVIFSSALDPRMIYVHMASSPIPLPAMKIAIDSPLVMKNSRHSITEAGLDTVVENLRKAEQHAGDSGKHDEMEYVGLKTAPGFDRPCNQFVIRSVSGDLWKIFLDPRSDLPCMVIAEDPRGELIER